MGRSIEKCLFCASAQVEVQTIQHFEDARRIAHFVRCVNCHAQGPRCERAVEAIVVWNMAVLTAAVR